MRNFVGGLFGAIIGLIISVLIFNPVMIVYPSPYDILTPLLQGSHVLQDISYLLNLETAPVYFIIWIMIGGISGIVSSSKWNTFRTAVWTGVVIAIFSLMSTLLQNPSFWTGNQTERNVAILLQFIQAISISQISVISAAPTVIIKKKIREDTEREAPSSIETICDCGAVFKSNPIICSECGKVLRPEAHGLISVRE
ncbi:MAG: conserved membrane protein of unknown function [Candidatus Thorarchaeota archaeon]|nr:MAG: conserved membrane protein of unknown function [Candidatus Thorarchaeota archaeon]